MADAGSKASPRPSRPTPILTPITSSLAGQPLLRLAQLGSIAVRVPREPGELLEVLARLLRVSRGLGGLGRPIEAAQPHRRVLERGLVFRQGAGRLALRQQHVGE